VLDSARETEVRISYYLHYIHLYLLSPEPGDLILQVNKLVVLCLIARERLRAGRSYLTDQITRARAHDQWY
jgi:hypothetical protein